MLLRRRFTSLQSQSELIASITCGRIIMRAGRLVSVEQHWLRSPVSIAQVWWESNHGRLRGDECLLDYHVPRGLPSFMTLDYIRSGSETSYRTFIGACHVLNEIARLRRADAIVAHVTNVRISDRLLERLSWQRHQEHWRGRHYIRRFYDGYPTLPKSYCEA
ncbi:hypothetical protein [Rhodopirellula sp. SWK7]|uniref:hypothetical protein n=1 Tax=Rhodopirellula sp. SWK7 TaxID=595460 RepID=UPI0002BD996C|nr:hypothetical protein [Rhodopirellula sp. SWK7]EMI45964.1 hypothetical protein RRSWK_01571 [Rhodopirellula sp. SWK7]